MLNRRSPLVGLGLYDHQNNQGAAVRWRARRESPGNRTLNYIELKIRLVNNFNNFNNICNPLPICMEKSAIAANGSCVKVIILNIIFFPVPEI